MRLENVVLLKFTEKLTQAFSYPWNADRRIYGAYLLGALILASLFYLQQCRIRSRPPGGVSSWLRYLFSPRIFWHPSARLDYFLMIFNPVLLALLTGVILLSRTHIALDVSNELKFLFGKSDPNWSSGTVAALFTTALFIADDFTRYLLHWLLHQVPFLWAFHKVHHSAEVLTPITVYRIHPVESFLFANRMILTQGCVLGVFFYGFGMRLSAWDIAGANLFTFLFNLCGSNLRHSHIRLSYGPRLERFFISPAQHQLHHSNRPEHFNRNYGAFLAIWDGLFGNLTPSHGQRRHGFGLGLSTPNSHTSLWRAYIMPFVEVTQLLTGLWRKTGGSPSAFHLLTRTTKGGIE